MISITGGGGFLGWHTRVAARASGQSLEPVAVGDSFDLESAAAVLSRSSRVIHIAGVNRDTDDNVRRQNERFAHQLVRALDRADSAPAIVVFANSIQAGNGTPYGEAKRAASDLLADWCARNGADYLDVQLPNIFGEHGRPNYNSVTATFAQLLASGGAPQVETDRELALMHSQDAAELVLTANSPHDLHHAPVTEITVQELLEKLTLLSQLYRAGEIPDVSSRFDLNLFNTYRSFTIGPEMIFPRTRNEDARGVFTEVLRTHGGTGQSSHSTTAPGVTRGEHFHLRKVERFTVIEGEATIAMRRVLTDETLKFEVRGDAPVSIDMPTMWSHNITNTGDSALHTLFWTNDLFDPDHPDTFPEAVGA